MDTAPPSSDTVCLIFESHKPGMASLWLLPFFWDEHFPSAVHFSKEPGAQKVLGPVDARSAITQQLKLAGEYRAQGLKVQVESR